jgi:Ca2+-binding RTX toxin-like protein
VPTLTISTTTVVENTIGEIATFECEGAASYTLIADQGVLDLLEVVGNKLVVKAGAVLDHEAQNALHFDIQALDADGNPIGSLAFTEESPFTISNLNDNAPASIRLGGQLSLNVPENTQAGTFIGTLSAADADGDEIASYGLVGGNDFFDIEKDGGIWKVKLKAGVDYEVIAQQEHSLRIKATDDEGLSSEQAITINVTGVNDNAPSGIMLNGGVSLDISESTQVGTFIGELSATDADGDEIVGYELAEESAFFAIENDNGTWKVRLKQGVDYEAVSQREHTLKIIAKDRLNTSLEQDITINVTNVNDNAPTDIVLSNTSVSESARVGDVVGVLSATDPDGDPITGYALAANAFFDLVNENGTWQIKLKAEVDYETVSQREHTLRITATDGTRTSTVREITIKVVNANEPPTDIVVTGDTIGDNAILGATVARLEGQDPDRGDQLTYTIVDETGTAEYNHPYFGISGNEIVVKSDLGNAPIGVGLPVYVKVTDAKGLSYVKEVTLNVHYVNKAPTINSELMEVLDGAKGGTVVAVLSAQDVDSSHLTFKLSKTSSTWFHLVDNQDGTYDVVVNDGFTLELGLAAFESFVVEVSDNNDNTTTETVFLNINENLDPEPTFEFLEIEKNTPAGTLVGTLIGYDPEGQSISYTLTGENAGLFTLVKNANGTYGVLVRQGVALDYTDEAQHSFTVRVSDGFNVFEETFDLVFGSFAPRVTDAPPISVKEGVGGNTVVARFKVTDPDIDDAVDCSLAPDSEALFDLEDYGNGNYAVVVREGVKLDYENRSHHIASVIVSDGSNTVTRDFAVNVTDEIDTIIGTARADSLTGTAGRDIIKGLAGNDSLAGNTGDDTLYGGAGKDVMNGGMGRDVFVFDSKPNKKTNLDKVVDFKVADDSIWLENKIFTKLGKKGSEAAPAQLKKSFFVIGDKAKDKDDYIIYSKKTGKLYFDVDGSGSKAAVEIATLSKKLAMTNKDFFVI